MFTCQAISSVLMTRVNSLRVGFWRSCSPLVIQNHKGTCWKVFCCHGCTTELFWHIFPRLKRWKKSVSKEMQKKNRRIRRLCLTELLNTNCKSWRFGITLSWTFKSSIIFVRLDYCTFGPFWPFPAKTERSKTKLNRLFHTMSLYHWTWAKNVISCHIIASHR